MLIVLTRDVDVGRLVQPRTGWLSLHRFAEQPLRSAHRVKAIYADLDDYAATQTALIGWPIFDEISAPSFVASW